VIRITPPVDSGLRPFGSGPATRPFRSIFAPCTHLLLAISCFLALESFHMPESRTVVVYSRKGCHLCEVVKESLSKLSRRGGFTWQEVDVDMDSDLRRQYNDEVPVVFIDGRKAFKYRMDEREFLRRLAS
jgi:glutaredoxin